ncbi:MAG TPA: TRAP transporter small permease [Rhodospirillales bacterium]|nr:TRAP transporter small permease [Rhodospirillales bacterium]
MTPESPQKEIPPGGPGGILLRALETLSRWLAVLAAGLGALVVLGLTALIAYSVVMRYLANRPQTWTDELAGYLMVLIVMLGVGEAARRGDHIGVDLVTRKLGPRGRRWARIWGWSSTILVAAVLFRSSLEMVGFSRMVGLMSEGYVEVPVWIPQSALVLGMGLLLLVAASRLLLELLRGPDPDDEPS